MNIEYSQVKILAEFKNCVLVLVVSLETHLQFLKTINFGTKNIKVTLNTTLSYQIKNMSKPYKNFHLFINLTGGKKELEDFINSKSLNAYFLNTINIMGVVINNHVDFHDNVKLSLDNPYYYYDKTVSYPSCMALFKFLTLTDAYRKQIYGSLTSIIPRACRPTLFMSKTDFLDSVGLIVFRNPNGILSKTIFHSYNVVPTFFTLPNDSFSISMNSATPDYKHAIVVDNFFYYSAMDFIEDFDYKYTFYHFYNYEMGLEVRVNENSELVIIPAPTLAMLKHLIKLVPPEKSSSLVKLNLFNGNIDVISSDSSDEAVFSIEDVDNILNMNLIEQSNYAKRSFMPNTPDLNSIIEDSDLPNYESYVFNKPTLFDEILQYIKKNKGSILAKNLSNVFDISVEELELLGNSTASWALVGTRFILSNDRFYFS